MPVRIVHIVRVAVEQGVADKPLLQGDREGNSGLAWVTRSNGVREPAVNVLAGPKQLRLRSCTLCVTSRTDIPNLSQT